jgi:hypothetical protein
MQQTPAVSLSSRLPGIRRKIKLHLIHAAREGFARSLASC